MKPEHTHTQLSMGCHCLWFREVMQAIKEAVTHKIPPVTADSVSKDVCVSQEEAHGTSPADFPMSSLSPPAPRSFIIYRAHVRDVELKCWANPAQCSCR